MQGVTYHGYDVAGLPSGTHRGLPSPSLTVVVGIDDPITMVGASGPVDRDSVVGGLHREPVTIAQHGRQRGVYVAVDPLHARSVLGLPAGALTAPDLDGADVLGAVARELHERVNAAADWAARFAVLDELLGAADPGRAVPSDEVRRAWRLLVRGRTAVRAVADDVGWSERHLERRFRAEFGLAPKALARVARFDRVRGRLGRRAAAGTPLGLADLAAEGGYADQAHLTREFGAHAGCSPTTWVREEVGDIQGSTPIGERSSTVEVGEIAEVGNVQDAGGPGGAPFRA